MSKTAIIGGSGFSLHNLPGFQATASGPTNTPYGAPSAQPHSGVFRGREILFLPRHGDPHTIPPHKINYRANIHILKECGATAIFAINTVGGITKRMAPETIVAPRQIIDYSYGREHTFHDGVHKKLAHTDFSHPYDDALRKTLIDACSSSNQAGLAIVFDNIVYAITQGPRLETAAEIRKLERDGCDIVGMTGMPEAALATELEIPYACLALVVNWAAGKTPGPISEETIKKNHKTGMKRITKILEHALELVVVSG